MVDRKKYPVRLSAAERELLTRVVRTGASPAQQVRRARILLELDIAHADDVGVPVATQEVIAERAGVSIGSVAGVARVYAQRGGDVEAVITRKKRLTPPVPAIVTGDVEARVIAMACSPVPPGASRWSLRLLEKHLVLVEDLPDLDHSTIGRILSKHHFAPT